MKNPDRKTVTKLEALVLPNIGKTIEADLRLIGIEHPRQLSGKDLFDLYGQLCEKTGTWHDPCVIDVFMAAVDFMEGGEPKPWWGYTKVRKDRLKAEG